MGFESFEVLSIRQIWVNMVENPFMEVFLVFVKPIIIHHKNRIANHIADNC